MAMTVTNTVHDYDGVLSRAVFTITGGSSSGNATTTASVIGQIVQVGISLDTGNLTVDEFILEDSTNSCQLTDIDSISDTDLMPDDINAGGGAYCRGPLKLTVTYASGTSTNTITATVYYIKM